MKRIKLFILFLVSFLYIFGPLFNSVGAWADTILVISTILSIYGIVIYNLQFPSFLKCFTFILPVFIFAIIIIAESSYTTVGDYIRFTLKPLRIFITIYAGYVLVFLLRKHSRNDFFGLVLLMIFWSVLFHAGIMAYQLYSPEFKDLVYSYTTSGFRSSYGYNFRMGGLGGGTGGSVLSVVQSLGIIIIPFLFKRGNGLWRLLLVISGLFIFFSILICGRSGIYSVILFLPISIYLASESKGVKFWFSAVFAILFLIALFLCSFLFFDAVEAKTPLYYALRRSLDTFLSYRTSGSFDDPTVDVLVEYILLPTDIKTWLIGNGEHIVNTQFDRTLKSDLGFIRNIWSYGFFIAFFYWLPILYLVFCSFKLSRKYEQAAVLFMLSMIMLLFHAKESFLYVRMFMSIYSLILFSLYFGLKERVIYYR